MSYGLTEQLEKSHSHTHSDSVIIVYMTSQRYYFVINTRYYYLFSLDLRINRQNSHLSA